MLFLFQLFVYFTVDLDVLKSSMEHYQDFSVDGPVVQIGNQTFEDYFN